MLQSGGILGLLAHDEAIDAQSPTVPGPLRAMLDSINEVFSAGSAHLVVERADEMGLL